MIKVYPGISFTSTNPNFKWTINHLNKYVFKKKYCCTIIGRITPKYSKTKKKHIENFVVFLIKYINTCFPPCSQQPN